eukprot:SAG31_NODE_5698_length_2373_cov_20.644239_3_plen_64_part_01
MSPQLDTAVAAVPTPNTPRASPGQRPEYQTLNASPADGAQSAKEVRGYFLVIVQLYEKYGTLIE